jgi:hypothetical protein
MSVRLVPNATLNRLCVDAPPLGTTKLTELIDQHKDTLGRQPP